MSTADAFDLADLAADGPRAAELRDGLERAIDAGVADPLLALKLARICQVQGRFGDAHWFLALGMKSPTYLADGWPSLLRDSLAAALDGPITPADIAGTAKVLAAAGSLTAEAQDASVDAILEAFSDDRYAARSLIGRVRAEGDSTMATTLELALRSDEDSEATAELERRLGEQPEKSAVACAILAGRQATRGDLAATRDIAAHGISRHGPSESLRGIHAGALLALGGEPDATADDKPLTNAVWRHMRSTAFAPAPATDYAIQGLRGLVRFLDRLSDPAHEDAMQDTVDALAADPPAAAARLEAAATPELRQFSPSFLGLELAVRGLIGSRPAESDDEDRLAGLGGPVRFAYRMLAKLAMLEGDHRRAADILDRGVAARVDARSILLERAAALFCAGEIVESRVAVARAFAAAPADEIRRRQQEGRDWSAQLADAIARRRVDGGAFGQIGSPAAYTQPDHVSALWRTHREDCAEEKALRSVNAWTNTVMFERIEALIAAEPDLRKVVNFGTLCGIREAALAGRHPETTWAGYDIAETATELNRANFQAPNLMFSSDLNALLGALAERPGTTLLAHCRTADVMLPEALKTVYRCCHDHGVEKILAAEYFSICVPTLDYPNFAANPVDTVHWDGVLMIHNYDSILPDCGYRVVSSEYRPVPLMVYDHGLQEALLIRLVLAERVAGTEGSGDA